jgi:hypothetical protein
MPVDGQTEGSPLKTCDTRPSQSQGNLDDLVYTTTEGRETLKLERGVCFLP